MENLLFLGVPVFKHIRVDLFPFVKSVEKHGGVHIHINKRPISMLQIRTGYRDNLGIISHISP